MKRLGMVIALLISSTAMVMAAGADRFTVTAADTGIMQGKENPAEVRARMNTPEVQELVKYLKDFLASQKDQTKASANGSYVGSEFCIACHQSKAGFRDTLHRKKIQVPRPDTIVNDYNQNGINDFEEGLDFNQISSAFDAYKPNAPILGFDGTNYTITIGDLTMPLVAVQGGFGWKQRYVVRVPVTGTPDGLTADNYISPIQYNLETHGYVVYHGSDWYDGSNQPKFAAGVSAADFAANNTRSYSKGCIGCHSTGVKSITQDANGEWQADLWPAALFDPDDPSYWDFDHDGNADLTNIGCESCHGPGSEHILGGGDPAKIVNPDDLTYPEANQVCGQCHLRPKSVPNKLHSFPYNETEQRQWIPGSGEDLNDFGTDAAGYWGDGKHSTKHHQQWLDFEKSSKPSFPYHPVTCWECHESHRNTTNKHQIVEHIEEETDTGTLSIATDNDDNTLCLACHATHGHFADITKEMVADYEANKNAIAAVVSEHTNHPYGPDRSMGLSRCSKCHMPKVAKSAVAYDIHSHTFEAIAPQKTVDFVMPNSCAVSCHDTKVNSFGFGLDANPTVWNEQFDLDQAAKLAEYYGIGGKWWDTSEEK